MTPAAPGTLLDLAVALLVLAAVLLGARAGWRSGASRSVLSLAGVVAGAVVGPEQGAVPEPPQPPAAPRAGADAPARP